MKKNFLTITCFSINIPFIMDCKVVKQVGLNRNVFFLNIPFLHDHMGQL